MVISIKFYSFIISLTLECLHYAIMQTTITFQQNIIWHLYTPPSLQRPKKSQNNFLALFLQAKSSPGFNGFSYSMNTPESGVGIPIIASCSKLHSDRCEICENGDKSLRNRHESYRYNVLKTTRAVGMHLY